PVPKYPPIRVDDGYVTDLERACDEYNEDLPTLRSFVLPGGTPGAALLHTARTVVRRAERSAWAALAAHPRPRNLAPAGHPTRRPALLSIRARQANPERGDALWKPGGER